MAETVSRTAKPVIYERAISPMSLLNRGMRSRFHAGISRIKGDQTLQYDDSAMHNTGCRDLFFSVPKYLKPHPG